MQNEEETGQITTDEEHSASELIQKLAGRLRRSRRLTVGTLLAAAAFFPFAYAGLDGDLGISGFVMLAGELLFGLGGAAYLRQSFNRAAASLEDWKALGALIEAQQDTDRETRKVSETVLLRLLTRLAPSDVEHIAAPQRQRLWNLLPRASHTLAPVILQAMGILDDPQALPIVQKLAAGEGVAQSDPLVRRTAIACLDRLKKQREGTLVSNLAAEAHPEQKNEVSSAGLITLVDDLEHEQYTVRKQALQRLQGLDSSALGATLTSIQTRIKGLKRQWRSRFAVTSAVGIGQILLSELSMLGTPGVQFAHNHIQIVGMSLVLGAILGWPLIQTRQRIRRAQGVLPQIEDVRVCGPLLELWHSGDPETRLLVEASLVRLLPLFRASDVALLNARQHDLLDQVLSSGSVGLTLAVLKALEQIGDKRELPLVERLAAGGGLAKREERVRQAAQECLPYLQQRVLGMEANQTLLRASDRLEASDTLLRAAQNSTATSAEQLLRAGSQED